MTQSSPPPATPLATHLRDLRERMLPGHIVGEILSKDWIDTLIPAGVLALVLAFFAITTPGFFGTGSLVDLGRMGGEYIFIAIGAAIIMMAGGIDLSVGSVFALCNLLALTIVMGQGVPVALALPVTVVAGALLGGVTGFLVGYLRLRAFLTTLVMLVIYRAVFDLIILNFGTGFLRGAKISGVGLWDFLGDGRVMGLPSSLFFALTAAIIAHFVLTRGAFGWHVMAVGGSRRAAWNSGINLRRTVFLTYLLGGALTGLAAFFFAARLNSGGTTTGLGMELVLITGLVLGGISLGGGRGSIAKAVFGVVTVLCIQSGMLRLGLASGGSSMVLGLVLILAIVTDIRWTNNRHKVLNRAYVAPVRYRMPPADDASATGKTAYAMNDRLAAAVSIGEGEIDGPEDVILDQDGHLYAGNRHGEIVRFYAPDYVRHDVFAHIGGHPLGMAFDAKANLVVCVSGMGLYSVDPQGKPVRLTSQTSRSRFSILDDSRIRMADDLDIAPDGRIFFTDPTIRYELSEWLSEALEMRGNGRLLCYDPATGHTTTVLRKLIFPNGVCMMRDGQSLLIASTWSCSILRYWHSGPRAGDCEAFISSLPGYPDNINRAADGTYWCALVGMRSPSFDLMSEFPDVRSRMIRRVAPDNWLFANTNSGCIIRFDETGKVLESLWDASGVEYSHVTSMREHKGELFIGGLRSNRIGRIATQSTDQGWTGPSDYWGARP